MIHQFHPAAREELVATVDYYEAALPGLGAHFEMQSEQLWNELISILAAVDPPRAGSGEPS